ncbi:MAG: transcription elongation factor GreA [Hyphomicrobium sp.]
MSRAFVKEDSGEGIEDLPDRPISPHPNLVTIEGLEGIEKEVLRLNEAYASAQSEGNRILLQRLARDLRYWSHRRQTAQIVEDPRDKNHIQFGSRIRILRQDGHSVLYRIVGEDEANPSTGTLSYVSPLAKALMGKECGETINVHGNTFEILEIL